jgi:prophage regulatory protein
MSHKILRLPDVIQQTGLSRSSIYLRIANREFPQPISLGGRSVGWLQQEVDEWLIDKIETSRIKNHG